MIEQGRIYYFVEEFNIPYEYKRLLAEFFNTVRRLYYIAEELRERLAKCSATSSELSDEVCKMAIFDKYIVMKQTIAELGAYGSLDEVIREIIKLRGNQRNKRWS
jgi:hypothetical protein